MSGCLYYLPARLFNGPTPDTLKGDGLAAHGLGHLDGARLAFRGVRNHGPDGGAGLCIGLAVPASETGIFPGQTWQACNGGDLWLGWLDGAQPGPEVFLRANALDATNEIALADGHLWGFVETRALPEVMGFDTAGQVTWRPRAEDQAHYEASAWLMDYLLSADSRAYLDILTRVATCLGARYHISATEMLALRLFSTDLNLPVVCACLGIDYGELTGKKNAALTT